MISRIFTLTVVLVLIASSAEATRKKPVALTSLLSPKGKPFDDNGKNFDILTRLLNLANLTDTVAAASHFTLFAPNDAAFVRTAKYVTGLKGFNESEAFDALVAAVLEGVPVKGKVIKGIPLLRIVLLYHVVPYRITSKHIIGRVIWLGTLARKYIISIGNGELVDRSPATPNPVLVPGGIDIMVKNRGVVHVIDAVLIPVKVPVMIKNVFK